MCFATTVSPTIVAIGVVGLSIVYYIVSKPASNDGSPAPLKLPLMSDLHKSPITQPLVNWSKWARENGDVVGTKLMGIVPIIILNTSDAATELFSRRSQWYSNRPPSVTMDMITGAEPGQCRFTLMHDYDAHLKLHHRLLTPSLGPISAPRYMPMMELEANQLLRDLLEILQGSANTISSKAAYPLLERTQSSIILALHYGMRIANFSDPVMHEVIDVQTKITHLAANPLLPDMLPFLRYLPGCLSPWQRSADQLYAEQEKLYMELFQHGKNSAAWNATKQALQTAKKVASDGVPDLELAFTLATSIQGGMETTPRQIQWLFVAAIQDPSFVHKAHDILDAVVGRDRLPQFSDREQLSYIEAIVHEMLRWRPISPGSIPRRADKADELNGVKIPKGAIIMANAFGIGRDSAVFDTQHGDLQEFHPERWLREQSDNETKTSGIRNELPLPVFGQGRRMCLGKRVALDGTFVQIAHLLWAFDILPAGEAVDPWNMSVTGFMTIPTEFKFKLVPRGPWVTDVVQSTWQAADKDLATVMGTSAVVE
ncbi:cytochrome P450 2F5 [Sarocladium strictum]